MAELLQGKNALITGAGRGIGRAVAIALAKEGVNVGLLARSEENLKAVAKEVEAEGVKAVIATADVSSYEEVTTAIETLKNGLGSYLGHLESQGSDGTVAGRFLAILF